ncbi:hypothetical protein VFPFJ_05105 [Purpureocillium lilacinum]|uniref:Uncharacterized protein n=1 Tax=Purpureocillium lilacinum TaxID=33203 RepID=A0A179HKM0_PURLI|nr:hypothetical protein VFPFJ_05105 [Purpureocillium lilacinum]OAQ90946.1 hypothetical protein VFPFJ_05105 [Purpureocillium lilacinum]
MPRTAGPPFIASRANTVLSQSVSQSCAAGPVPSLVPSPPSLAGHARNLDRSERARGTRHVQQPPVTIGKLTAVLYRWVVICLWQVPRHAFGLYTMHVGGASWMHLGPPHAAPKPQSPAAGPFCDCGPEPTAWGRFADALFPRSPLGPIETINAGLRARLANGERGGMRLGKASYCLLPAHRLGAHNGIPGGGLAGHRSSAVGAWLLGSLAAAWLGQSSSVTVMHHRVRDACRYHRSANRGQ